MDRRHPLGVGFDFPQLRPVEHPEFGDTVRFAAPEQSREPVPFGLAAGDDHLARE